MAMMPPSSLPSPSPSSYFNMSAGFLDSPILLNPSLFPSPMTGAFPLQPFNWMGTQENDNNLQGSVKQDDQRHYSGFTFQTTAPVPAPMAGTTSTSPASFLQSSMPMAQPGGDSYNREQQQPQQQQPWSYQADTSMDVATTRPAGFTTPFDFEAAPGMHGNNGAGGGYSTAPTGTCGGFRAQSGRRSSDDGYNWRKYGQKQMKGSENPRSYYKCSAPGCPTKKKVEQAPDGHVTEIVYKGTHNHPKPPQNARRGSGSSSGGAWTSYAMQAGGATASMNNEVSGGDALSGTPENSSASYGDDEANIHGGGGEEFEVDEPESKRWRGGEGAMAMCGNRTVREPRVVVQTISDIDILDDGYRWRKYGQKVVKGNPNPRSYYKCTMAWCPVRKHVERASQDLRAVVTTYEGKHNHDVPAARGSAAAAARYRATPMPAASSYMQGHSSLRPEGFGGAPTTQHTDEIGGSFALSGFGNAASYSSYPSMQQQQQQNDAMYYAAAKDEPRDDDRFFGHSLMF